MSEQYKGSEEEAKDRRIAELEEAIAWYIKHVETCEGTDFLSDTHTDGSDEPHRSRIRPFRKEQY